MKRFRKLAAVFAATLMLIGGACPAFAAETSSSAASVDGSFQIESERNSVPDYDLIYTYYNGLPYGEYTVTTTYYKDIDIPTGYTYETDGYTDEVLYQSGFSTGDDGQLKQEIERTYKYKFVRDS